MIDKTKSIMRVLAGEALSPPPIWMMRQAGRYLPEYRATRAEAGSFLNLCYTPKYAVEVTHQPIRRYGFDAAILFSDILVIPDALGQEVRFETGTGPQLTPLNFDIIPSLNHDQFDRHLAPVYKTVSLLRERLDPSVTLLGFCGAPWTVATYMIAGHGTSDQAPARLASYNQPLKMEALFDVLVAASAHYLTKQIEAGADAVQIFDTWSGVLDDEGFDRYVIAPTRQLVEQVRSTYPDIPVIGFPKGSGYRILKFIEETGVSAVGVDWNLPLNFIAKEIQPRVPVQGNLDPMRLIAGGEPLKKGVKRILDELGAGPLIFNLGHGVTPDANPDHVQEMIDYVRAA